MTAPWHDILIGFLLLLGCFFMLTSAVGLIRMPNFFLRLHPAGVGDSAALACIILAAAVHSGFSLVTAKLLILLLFSWIASPAACHALGKAALLGGLTTPPLKTRTSKKDSDAV